MTDTLGHRAELDEVFSRLGSLEKHGAKLEERFESFERIQLTHGEKIDRIMDAVRSYRSFNITTVIDVGAKAVVLIATLCAGIIYISTNINASRLAVIEYRIEKIYDQQSRVNSQELLERLLKRE